MKKKYSQSNHMYYQLFSSIVMTQTDGYYNKEK